MQNLKLGGGTAEQFPVALMDFNNTECFSRGGLFQLLDRRSAEKGPVTETCHFIDVYAMLIAKLLKDSHSLSVSYNICHIPDIIK